MMVGEYIRKIRKEQGLTQKQLAVSSGLSVTSIQYYECGKFKPKFEQVERIATVLGKNPIDLYQALSCCSDEPKAPVFGDYWVAEISFFKGNWKSRYVIRIGVVRDTYFYFTPFLLDSMKEYKSDSVNEITLIRKINMEI